MTDKKHILFNVDIAGWKKGELVPLDKSDETLRGPISWLENKDILIEQRICFLADEDRNIIEKEFVAKVEVEIESEPENEIKTDKIRCKGIKTNGYQCNSYAPMENGYCVVHQAQAPDPIETKPNLRNKKEGAAP